MQHCTQRLSAGRCVGLHVWENDAHVRVALHHTISSCGVVALTQTAASAADTSAAQAADAAAASAKALQARWSAQHAVLLAAVQLIIDLTAAIRSIRPLVFEVSAQHM